MSESGPEKDPVAQAAPRAGRGRRAWWILRAVLLVVVAPVLMAAIAAVMLIGREVSAPSWIVRDVEARAAEVLAGGSLGFGDMTVTVGEDLHPRLVLSDAVLRDADGAVLAQVPRIEGLVSPRGVMQGRILAQEVNLRGAQISVRRAKDGTVAFAFRQGAQNVAAADSFLGLLDQVDEAFAGAALEALEQVHADGLIINYTDARAGRSWVVDNGRISLDLRDEALALRADVALLSGRSYVTTAEMTYTSPRGARTAELGLAIDQAAAPDIASQAPVLSWLGVLDAPISGSMRGLLDEDGGLDSLSATLQIGAGELRPTVATRPIPFDGARTYLRFDPADQQLTFDLIEIDSALGRVSGSAETYLREYTDGWPAALLGQVALTDVSLTAPEVFDTPLEVPGANVDFRLRLDPFTLDIGEAVVMTNGADAASVPVRLNGQVRAATEGWSVALDAETNEITPSEVLSLWPAAMAPKTRGWLSDNIQRGRLRDVTLAYRGRADAAPQLALSMEFSDAEVRFMRTLPPIEAGRGTLSLVGKRLVLALDGGHVTAPQGGQLDMAGSTMIIPQTGPRAPARFDLTMDGRVTAAMAVLNLDPFAVLRNSDLPVSFAQGQARITASIDTPLGRDIAPDERQWQASAQLRNLRSQVLVPGQILTASRAEVAVDADSLVVSGPMRLGDVGGTARFARALGAGSEGTARLEADVTIGPAFLQAFNINLPRGMVSGQGTAQIALDLGDPAAPDFTLTSDLRGIGLSLPSVGWSKATSSTGALTVAGQLGATPRIDQLALRAPGLETAGTVRLAPGGGLERAAFERVQLGGWLDAPVVLVGRGAGQAAEVQIAGGSLDLRSANFGAGGGGEGGPLDIALDRLRVTDSIFIDNFRGQFTPTSGLQGQFQGDVNGAAPVRGTMVPVEGRSAVRIVSDDAGSLLRATGLLRGATGGQMQLTLIPAGAEGSYDGTVVGNDLRVRDAPALANLLDAVSVVGLLTQLDGQGLMFTDVDAQFRLTPNEVIVTQSSAVGPSIGLSLDGIYSTAAGVIDFQGVVSPLYLINGIGSVLTRPGEGLIGFNFNLRGPVDNPAVSVNPLSVLTPGMFRDIFRRPAPTVGQ